MFLTLASMALWMLMKGVDQAQWDAKQVILAIAELERMSTSQGAGMMQ